MLKKRRTTISVLIIALLLSACGKSASNIDIERQQERVLAPVMQTAPIPTQGEEDLNESRLQPPLLDNHLEILDNELFFQLGVLPIAANYQYELLEDKCTLDGINYKESIRFVYTGGLFDIDGTLQLYFTYNMATKTWEYLDAEFSHTEQTDYLTYNIKGSWMLEGIENRKISPAEEYGVELQIIIGDFDSTWDGACSFGRFHWLATNLVSAYLSGEGEITYLGNNELLLSLRSEQMNGGWVFAIYPQATEYPEYGGYHNSIKMIKQ